VAGFLTEILSAAYISLHDWSRATPYRPFWRLYWAREDRIAWIHHHRQVFLGPDRIVAVAPHTRIDRGLIGDGACRHLHLHALFGEPVDRLRDQVQVIPFDAALHALVEPVVDVTNRVWREARAQLRVLPLATAIAARLDLPSDQAQDPLVADCCAFIEEHLAERCPNEVLAALAGRSVNQLLRRFKAVTGLTPQTWLRHQRLERAAIMLEQGEATIEDIAEACGFADRSHLTRRFSQHFGVGPGARRRRAIQA